MTIGILASGTLGYNVLEKIFPEEQIIFVMTNKHSKEIIFFCTQNNIPCFVGNPRNDNLKNFTKGISIDILISVNYLYLINEELISLPKRLAFNLHGSLLPKYRGRTPHVWAIINGEEKTGITAHKITLECDTGPIIYQEIIDINPADSGADILNKFDKKYFSIIQNILTDISRNTLSVKEQNHAVATYFGKRIPEDGRINWNWFKERIFNWVRAQKYPYPGAFTLYKEKKVVIDEVKYSDMGYHFDMPNGLIVNTDPLRIKTSNGVVEITKIRNRDCLFIENEIFK